MKSVFGPGSVLQGSPNGKIVTIYALVHNLWKIDEDTYNVSNSPKGFFHFLFLGPPLGALTPIQSKKIK